MPGGSDDEELLISTAGAVAHADRPEDAKAQNPTHKDGKLGAAADVVLLQCADWRAVAAAAPAAAVHSKLLEAAAAERWLAAQRAIDREHRLPCRIVGAEEQHAEGTRGAAALAPAAIALLSCIEDLLRLPVHNTKDIVLILRLEARERLQLRGRIESAGGKSMSDTARARRQKEQLVASRDENAPARRAA